jgi:F-type H+-transporting ATPase subunit b
MSPALTTFLFEAANFLILAGLLGWLLFQPVRTVIAGRRQQLAEELEQARRQQSEAESLRAAMMRERQALNAELEQERARARAEAEREAAALLAAAREQSRQQQGAARQATLSLQRAEEQRLGRAAAAAAREVVLQLLAQIGAADLNQSLVQAARRELSRLDNGALEPVTVESAQPLGAEERAALAAVFGPDVTPNYRVVPDLVAGVRVITRRGMVDASAAGLATYAEQALAAAVREAIDE